MADKSNPQQLAAGFILFMEILTELPHVPILFIWNKL